MGKWKVISLITSGACTMAEIRELILAEDSVSYLLNYLVNSDELDDKATLILVEEFSSDYPWLWLIVLRRLKRRSVGVVFKSF